MKRIVVVIAALIVCTSFSFAADLDSNSFDVYSLDPLTNSALDYAVMPLADASWSTSDSSNLADIAESLTNYGSRYTVAGFLFDIRDYLEYMPTINTNIDHISDILGYGDSVSAYPSIYSLLYHSNELLFDLGNSSSSLQSDLSSVLTSLNSLLRVVEFSFSTYPNMPYPLRVNGVTTNNASWNGVVGDIYQQLGSDSLAPWSATDYTLYHYIKNLSDVLATEDDKALAQSQKANREEIEDSFLSGSSGSTSLGASDFADLSDVGGTVNDTLSLNGQASISSFTSGLSGADQEGQNWFSAATRDSLDSVSGGISTFALDDTYNMEGWEEQYSWVLGGE